MTYRRLFVGTILLGGFLAAACGSEVPRAESGGNADTASAASGWPPPERVLVDSAILPRFPMGVTVDGQTMILFQTHTRAGSALPIAGNAKSVVHDSVGWSAPHPLSELPAMETDLRISVSAPGKLVSVWREGAAVFPEQNRSQTGASRLRLAEYTNSKWSKSTVVDSSDRDVIRSPAAPVTDARGGVHVAWFSTRDNRFKTFGPSVLYRRRSANGKWSPVTLLGSGIFPSLLRHPEGRLFAFFIAPALRANNPALFVRSSVNYGIDWSVPTLIDSTVSRSPVRAKAVVDERGVVHLLWGQDANHDGVAESFGHSTSADGLTWTAPSTACATGDGTSLSFDVEIDPQSQLHLVFDRAPTPMTRQRILMACRFAHGAWSRPVPILDLNDITNGIQLFRNNRDGVSLTLYSGDTPGGAGIAISHYTLPTRNH